MTRSSSAQTVAAQAAGHAPAAAAEVLAVHRNRVLAKFLRNRSAVAGAVIVLAFVALALLAPMVAPFDPNKTNFVALRQAAVRDLLARAPTRSAATSSSRLIHGGIASLYAGRRLGADRARDR